MSLSTTIHARLAADPTLVALLSTYRGQPAVVVGDEDTLPEDIICPFVIIAGPTYVEPDDAKNADGRETEITIRVYTDATGSTVAVEAIAERVRALLHRLPHGLADGAWMARVSGPVVAPTDSTLYGRELVVRVSTLTIPQPSEEDPS